MPDLHHSKFERLNLRGVPGARIQEGFLAPLSLALPALAVSSVVPGPLPVRLGTAIGADGHGLIFPFSGWGVKNNKNMRHQQ